jgi:hypothetical protein
MGVCIRCEILNGCGGDYKVRKYDVAGNLMKPTGK